MAKRKTRRTAKKKRKKKAPKPAARKVVMEGWWQKISEQSKRSALRFCVHMVLVGALVAGIVWSLRQMETYVHNMDRYDGQIEVELVNVPDWLTEYPNVRRDLEQRASDDVEALVAEHGGDRRAAWFDDNLADNIAGSLGRNHYVGKVVQVEKRLLQRESPGPDQGRFAQRVVMEVQFRRPLAQVPFTSYDNRTHVSFLVDREGWVLDSSTESWPKMPHIIKRLSDRRWTSPLSRMPEKGTQLNVPEVQAGLDVLSRLRSEPFYKSEIALGAVDVGNFERRYQPSQSEIVLLVPPPTGRNVGQEYQEIGWGNRIGSKDRGDANTTDGKLADLRKLYRSYNTLNLMDKTRGRIDLFIKAGQPWWNSAGGAGQPVEPGLRG